MSTHQEQVVAAPAIPTILVVDDEKAYLRFLEELLVVEGYRVLTASNGVQALSLARERQPELVLLDLHLARGIDGLAVCRDLKGDQATNRIPVIAITGMSDDRTRLASLSSGANEYLAKPVDPAELLLRVRNMLRLRQADDLHTRNELLVTHQAILEEKNRQLEEALRGIRESQLEREQLQERVRRMEQNELIGRVAAGVAHEVRNPLHAISSLTEALCRKVGGGEEYAPFVEHLRAQVERLAGLMRELLDFGKPLDRERLRAVKVQEVCRDVEEHWRAHPAVEEHPLRVELSEAAGAAIMMADPAKLVQAVMNLLENGADHSAAGMALLLRVLAAGDGCLIFEVVDTGAGIPETARGRVFEPFFTTRRKGTGLGLSIVRRIAEDCGGRIELHPNSTGPGTSARLTVPVAAAESP